MLQNSTVLILQLVYFDRFPQLPCCLLPTKSHYPARRKTVITMSGTPFLTLLAYGATRLGRFDSRVGGILVPTSRPSCWDFFAVIFWERVYKLSFNYEESPIGIVHHRFHWGWVFFLNFDFMIFHEFEIVFHHTFTTISSIEIQSQFHRVGFFSTQKYTARFDTFLARTKVGSGWAASNGSSSSFSILDASVICAFAQV